MQESPARDRQDIPEATDPRSGQGSDAMEVTWQQRGLAASEAVLYSGQRWALDLNLLTWGLGPAPH